MKEKVVEVKGHKFLIHKLPADVGSFILMRLMGEVARIAMERSMNGSGSAEAEPAPEAKQPTAEDRVRGMCFLVFSGGLSFDNYRFIQKHCFMVARQLTGEQQLPIPVISDDGGLQYRWADPEMATDHALATQLTMEVCIFNFADFFEEKGPGSPKA